AGLEAGKSSVGDAFGVERPDIIRVLFEYGVGFLDRGGNDLAKAPFVGGGDGVTRLLRSERRSRKALHAQLLLVIQNPQEDRRSQRVPIVRIGGIVAREGFIAVLRGVKVEVV